MTKMPFIDDEGRLFGYINVVDAFVFLVLIAVIIAGVVILNPFAPPPEEATRYATLDLESESDDILSEIEVGDKMVPENAGNITVTDKYVTPVEEGSSGIVRVRINGSLVEEESSGVKIFKHGENIPRVGRNLTLDTFSYTILGKILDISENDSKLSTSSRTFPARFRVPSNVADNVRKGDIYKLGDEEVARITDKKEYPVSPGQMALILNIKAKTITLNGQTRFEGKPLKLNTEIRFATDDYNIKGKITEIGSKSRTNTTEKTVTLKLERISPDIAKNIQVGMTETLGNTRYARILNKTVKPAKITLTSEQGQIFERTDPVKKDVFIKTRLKAIETPTGLEFQNTPVKIGNKVFLDLGKIEITGKISEIGE
ncbi:MAG: DUF4330 family protein [Halobacteria archaeon]